MSSGPTIVRRARGSSSAVDLDTEAGRAFLQERLALYNKLAFITGKHVFSGATLVEVCSHHLHTAPEPPSARLGRPVPPALEAILLACLEKDPVRRPASALLLREALCAAPGVGEWSEEDARAWWARWRSRPAPPEQTP